MKKSLLWSDTMSFVDIYRCFGERLLSISGVEYGGHKPQATTLFTENPCDPQISHWALQIPQYIG